MSMLFRQNLNKKLSMRKGGSTRIYGTKKYENPLFPRKNNKNPRSQAVALPLKTKIIFAAAAAIMVATVWALIFSDYFKVVIITAKGEGRIDAKEVEEIAWQEVNKGFFALWPKDNIFLFKAADLKTELEKKYSFESLMIDKKYPGTLAIEYQEKAYALIWYENGNYNYIDEHGSVVSGTNEDEIKDKNYPLIENISAKKISGSAVPFSQEYLSFARRLFPMFADYKDDFILERFLADDEFNTVKAVLADGPQIYFDIQEDPERQMNKLVLFKREKLKDKFVEKTYVDIRYGDRVYYQ